jgi:folate-binding protein YgfZ
LNDDWRDFLARQGVRVHDNGPSSVRAHTAEKSVVTGGDFLCALTDQCWVLVDGADAEPFLQGQFTNDLATLTTETWQLGGYCSPQGRLLSLLRVCRHGAGFLLQLPIDLAGPMVDRLRRYVLRAKVDLRISGELASFALSGAAAQALLGASPPPPSPGPGHQCLALDEVLIWRHPGAQARCQLIGPAAALVALWQRADTRVVGGWAWHWQDIVNGIPVITRQTSEQFVPQMVNLDLLGGVSFKKGCYPGQEIVARMRYLGKLKQRMIRGGVAGEPPRTGDRLFAVGNEQAVGQVVAAQPSPHGDDSELLAVVKLSSLEGEIVVGAADGPTLTQLELPYPLQSAEQRQD